MRIVSAAVDVSRALALLVTCCIANANETIRVGTAIAESGERVRGVIAVAAGDDGVATEIPITVVNGAEAGPVLALIAGVHGSEYAPILAMQQVAGDLQAEQLAGAVIIVHIANLPSFQRRTIYVGPHDLKNLNRSFP
ncbi:MAG: succinylglutamate desuccinylase/aspartoacylase family protein, partial [Pseudomonadota bacterium]